MATVSGTRSSMIARVPGSRFDHAFFLAISVALTAAMAVGFARTYFLAGVFRAKLPHPIVHIHGVIFTLWFVVLVTQAALASIHRVDLHRRLGIAGIVIACLMVLSGTLVTAEFLARNPSKLIGLVAVMPVTELGGFAVLAAAAFLNRRNPAVHKRLIVLATVSLMGAALGRMEFLPAWEFHRAAAMRLFWGYTYVFIAALVVYDIWSTRRLNRATVGGSLFLISVQQIALLLWTTTPWIAFVHWMQSWGHF